MPTKPARRPAKPKPPAALDPAADELADEAVYRRLGFVETDLSGRTAALAEFEQCRFRTANLSNTRLERASFTDCLLESSDLANLRTVKSSLHRALVRRPNDRAALGGRRLARGGDH
ncbi:pentapeptide repeat-containing protein [Fodinicola feengrottensis]|uniref:pentapeptide repeat-containing protein n=1 Tax=Fodinicola feengrottensis TaxID=435914 RepID=UPI002441E3C5|nr:pentapeptide repeat-containing protein [Fodinicola feengrottensis]